VVIGALQEAARAVDGRLSEDRWNAVRRKLPGKDGLARVLGCEARWLDVIAAAGIGWRREWWTKEILVEAMIAWRMQYGKWPTVYDWSRAVAKGIRLDDARREDVMARFDGGCWPNASLVIRHFGRWAVGVSTAKHAAVTSNRTTKVAARDVIVLGR